MRKLLFQQACDAFDAFSNTCIICMSCTKSTLHTSANLSAGRTKWFADPSSLWFGFAGYDVDPSVPGELRVDHEEAWGLTVETDGCLVPVIPRL